MSDLDMRKDPLRGPKLQAANCSAELSALGVDSGVDSGVGSTDSEVEDEEDSGEGSLVFSTSDVETVGLASARLLSIETISLETSVGAG